MHDTDERPIDVIIGYTRRNKVDSSDAAAARIEVLEEAMESLDLECPDTGQDNMVRMEAICGEISALEDEIRRQDNIGADGGGDGNGNGDGDVDGDIRFKAKQVMEYFGITEEMQSMPMGKLSGGQKKKVLLACSLFCDLDLLLLDGTCLWKHFEY